MTKPEAIALMKVGTKVKHTYFSEEEWVTMDPEGNMLFEDGVVCSPEEFWNHRKQYYWNDGWEIFE